MADPRIIPLDVKRLPVPQAGLNGMRVQGAGYAQELGGENRSGSVSPTLGDVADFVNMTGKVITNTSQLAGIARTVDYQQTARQNQAELNQRADALNQSILRFEGSKSNFTDSAGSFSALKSITQGYQARGQELFDAAANLTTRQEQITSQSNQLMQSLRTTRDRTQQNQIRDQLTKLRDESHLNATRLGNMQAEATALNTSLKGAQSQLDSMSGQVNADKAALIKAEGQLRNDLGQFGQSAQNAMNDQQAYANFMTGVNYGGMSGNALQTMSLGLTDIQMGNYTAGALGIASGSFDFMGVLAPSMVGYSSIFKAAASGIGLGIDTGSPLAAVNRFAEMMGVASYLDGMLRSTRAFDQAYNNGNVGGMLAASFGASGNSLNFSGGIMEAIGGASPELVGISKALSIGGNFSNMAGAATLNLMSENASALTQFQVGSMNTVNALDNSLRMGDFGLIDKIGDMFQSINNLWEGRGLNNPSSPQWQEGMADLVFSDIQSRGEGVARDFMSAYQYGLGNQVVLKDTGYNIFNPPPMNMLNLFDGPSAPMSFPWSTDPVNPYDPFKSQFDNGLSQTFSPSYENPWDPNDPFNLDPSKRQGGQGLSLTGNVPAPSSPDCPKQPPQSKGRGTGKPPTVA